MATYLERAQKWVRDSFDLSAEQVESAIESMGFRLKDAQGLSEAQVQDIRDTLAYLNDELKRMVGAVEADAEDGRSAQAASGISEAEIAKGGSGAQDLDLSPLVPDVEVEPVQLSATEKAQAVNDLVASGLIHKGVCSMTALQNP